MPRLNCRKGSARFSKLSIASSRHDNSRWRGDCFVFDERVALGHGLRERAKETIKDSAEERVSHG